MTIGSIQLAAYGKENRILNGDPKITFFKSVQYRHSHFAKRTITMFPETSSPNRLSPVSPTQIRIKIPRHADLLHSTYLVVTLPDIYSHKVEGFRWVRAPGIAMIDRIVLRAGGVELQSLTREWLWIHSRLSQPLDKQDQWDRLVGNTPDMYDPRDPIKEQYPSSRSIEDLFLPRFQANSIPSLRQQISRANVNSQTQVPSIQGRELRIPLPFFFSQNVGKSLPLIALQYVDLEIVIHMRPYTELFTIRNAVYSIDSLRESTSSNVISRELRNAMERDPPTPYISPATNATMTLSNGEPSASNIVRYLAYNASFQDNTWNLDAKLEGDFIYLTEAERKQFAHNSHEFLVDDIFQQTRPVASGDTSVEYRIFHPVRQMFWWIQDKDVERTNEWMNWTQFDSADPFLNGIRDSLKGKYGVANSEYPIRAFQDTIEESLLGKDRISPSEIWLQDEHLQRGVIPQFFLKGFLRSPQVADPTAQQCLHILYRYGFKTRFGNWFLKRLQHVSNITHMHKLLKEAYEFMDLWKYRHPNDIPIIDRNNYQNYTEHAMTTATIQIHNHRDGADEQKSAEYWNYATSWNFHPKGFPIPGLFCNSFAIEPFKDSPTGSLNASMVESITIKLNIRTPKEEYSISNTSINVNPYINRRKTMNITVANASVGVLQGSTIEIPINPLTALNDVESNITNSFTVESNATVLLQQRTNDIIQYLLNNPGNSLSDYSPQSNLTISVPFGHYSYNVIAEEPTDTTTISSIKWNGLMDDVLISNFEFYKEDRLDFPQLIETGNILETKDPVEIFNDAAIRRSEVMDSVETRNTTPKQKQYNIGALFHRWNVIRIENGMAAKVFAN